MYVTVNAKAGFDRTYEADAWKIDSDENLAILKDGKVVATHAWGGWEAIYFSEVENG